MRLLLLGLLWAIAVLMPEPSWADGAPSLDHAIPVGPLLIRGVGCRQSDCPPMPADQGSFSTEHAAAIESEEDERSGEEDPHLGLIAATMGDATLLLSTWSQGTQSGRAPSTSQHSHTGQKRILRC
jgi:hypothetical protein